MSSIDENIKFQAEEAALLNVLMYLNMEDVKVEDRWLMSEIVAKLGTIYDPESSDGKQIYEDMHREKASDEDYKDRQRQYQILKNACTTNKHFANLKIGNQSRFMDGFSYNRGGLNACTFEDIEGNIYVVYRGTGPGEWIDSRTINVWSRT